MVFGRRKHAAPAPQPSIPPPAPPRAQAVSSSSSGAPTARQLARQNDRTVMRAQRDMQRERLRLESEERRIMAEVKALGRQGRLTEARMLAKNLVQVRNAKARTFQAGAQMSAIGNQAKMAQTDATMMNVINSATEVMHNANGLTDPEKQMNMVQQYDMQSEKYKLNQEMTDEVLDSVLGGEEVDTESDNVLNSVLDEIGLEVAASVGETPAIRPRPVQPVQHEQPYASNDADLMERIARLGGTS